MKKEFNQILDECIERINGGESLDACLRDYPEQASKLEPLLRTMFVTRKAYAFTPSDEALRTGRQRLYAAIEKRRQPSFWHRIFANRTAWAAVAGVIVISIVAYSVLRSGILPGDPPGGNIAQPSPGATSIPATATPEPPSEYIAAANPGGNFAFLVSDEVNAIADFQNVNVTIDRVGLLQAGDTGHWQEFTPEVKEFDLAQLPGEKTQELWRGNVPEGQYSKVFIYVSKVTGVLKSTGETIEIKLPSNKLQLSLPFEISAANLTSFTYDLTVVNIGNGKVGEKYHLKPQIGESGASQKPVQKYQEDTKSTIPPDTLTPLPVTNNSKK